MELILLDQSQKYIRKCAATAALWALFVIGAEIITELTGFHKYKVTPDPKTFSEVILEWPFFLISGLVSFAVVFIWKANQKERINMICPKCQDVVIGVVDEEQICAKCLVPLANLEGFFERHHK